MSAIKSSAIVYGVIVLQVAVSLLTHPEKIPASVSVQGSSFAIGNQIGQIVGAAVIWFIVIMVPVFIYRLIRKKTAGGKAVRTPEGMPAWQRNYKIALLVCFLCTALYCMFSPVILDNKYWPASLPFYTLGLTGLFALLVGFVFVIVYGIKSGRGSS